MSADPLHLTDSSSRRRMLVTSALPYANGSIHLGHLVEYIQADMWTRFQRMRGHECWFICADDTHGTPVMLRAEQEGIAPEELISRMRSEHLRDFTAFHVAFDHYGSTHSDTTRRRAESMYLKLKAASFIASREVKGFYDPLRKMFLPDRYVRGICPHCGTADQYGDSCEACGTAYSPMELKEPRSALSGATPELKSSEHYFFLLSRCREELLQFVETKERLQPEAVNKLKEWLHGEGDKALQDWDISRDAPYFGFPIPDAKDKYFYVWLDAPIGYFGSFEELCGAKKIAIDDFIDVNKSDKTQMYHFIGKDILYFHALFWPAMLKHSDHRVPTGVFAHGFLTVNGQKMSKSRGTFINAATYLKHLNPEYLRYYYATKLGNGLDDLDLNLEDFSQRVNSDLVGKYVNIAARSAGFLEKHFANTLHPNSGIELKKKLANLALASSAIAEDIEARQFGHAMRRIMQLADEVNQYTDQNRPWELVRDSNRHDELHIVCSVLIQAFRLLTLYLKPVLPNTTAKAEAFLNCPPLAWSDASVTLPGGHTIASYQHLMTRLDTKAIKQMLEDSKEPDSTIRPAAVATIPTKHEAEKKTGTISIEDFAKVELRVVRILKAEEIPGADKLLKLTLDTGSGARTVFAGIRNHYHPTQLEGQLTVAVTNLAPRKMKFGLSEGMVLAASGEGEAGLFLLQPHFGAKPGMKIK